MLAPFVRHAERPGWSQEALADLCARHGIDRAALEDLTAHSGLATDLRSRAEALVEEMGEEDITSTVRQSLRHAFAWGAAASLDRVARSLGMASRTLQRRLAEAGARFSALLEQVRCERAVELLQRPSADFNEVAERVGFSDARSLRRALKRQTGRTPSELRRGQENPGR
jgi:AraC-like DNA-binding protein